MPNEYISREAAQYKIREQNINPETPFGEGLSAAIDILQGIPAADVAEVVHARWGADADGDYYRCNACAEWQDRKTVYCPECGAKMDGGENHG